MSRAFVSYSGGVKLDDSPSFKHNKYHIINIAYLLLAFALSLPRCGAQQLRIGAPALGQLTSNDRGDIENQILGADYANQMMMISYPSVTGLEAANSYLQHISTFIERSTTAFRINVGHLTARTSMFVGCSSGVEGNVWTGAVERTGQKYVGRAQKHTIGDNAQCYGIIIFELNVQNVAAGGEVITGQASSLLSPEHTVTIPLKNHPFTGTAGEPAGSTAVGVLPHRARTAGSSSASYSTVTTGTIRTHLCLCRAEPARRLATTTTLRSRAAPRASPGRKRSAGSATRLVVVVAS